MSLQFFRFQIISKFHQGGPLGQQWFAKDKHICIHSTFNDSLASSSSSIYCSSSSIFCILTACCQRLSCVGIHRGRLLGEERWRWEAERQVVSEMVPEGGHFSFFSFGRCGHGGKASDEAECVWRNTKIVCSITKHACFIFIYRTHHNNDIHLVSLVSNMWD